MLLARTILQLDVGCVPPAEAVEMGQLGYLQWLAGGAGQESYVRAAKHAHETAAPFRANSPAIAVFCDLLIASIERPLQPLALTMPERRRRGGARARRLRRLPI